MKPVSPKVRTFRFGVHVLRVDVAAGAVLTKTKAEDADRPGQLLRAARMFQPLPKALRRELRDQLAAVAVKS